MKPELELPPSHAAAWSRLRMFNYYRCALALFFIVLYFNGWVEQLVLQGNFRPQLFYYSAIAYILLGIVFMLTISQQKPTLTTQVILQTSFDIFIILLLMYSVGGVRSGLGMLLIINIAMTSLFLPLRTTLLFAALASLCLLAVQTYIQLAVPVRENHFIQAGFLGMLLFVAAFLSSSLTTRLRQTEQLAAEQSEELESAMQMSEHIISNMRTGILVVRQNGMIEMANKAAHHLLSEAYIAEGSMLDQVAPKLFERFVEWQFDTDSRLQKPIQQSHGLPDIQPGFSNIEPRKGKHGRTLIFLEDASQLNQRFQQMKLASLGRLTASIAHEIRNPLAAIHHASQLLAEADLEPADARLTGIIHTQTRRLNTIVENVLQLSRQQRGLQESIRLLDWLQSFREEFCDSKGLPPDHFRLNISPADTCISFDPGQLHQVMWNLCCNSLDHSGMPPEQLTIDIQGGFSIDAEQPWIDIIDNGPGIDVDTAQQIFEPFYTTSADGTGLGLYITKEVVESNRAKISHITLPTGGTCFRIYFLQPMDASGSLTQQQS